MGLSRRGRRASDGDARRGAIVGATPSGLVMSPGDVEGGAIVSHPARCKPPQGEPRTARRAAQG